MYVSKYSTSIVLSSSQGTSEGLLMRFTAPVTSLAVSKNHSLLGAGSSDFLVKVLELCNLPSSFSLTGHEAPILSVKFDPSGDFLVGWEIMMLLMLLLLLLISRT